jgi:glutathione S-transferase
MEVPALEDGEFKMFDSTVILAYIEEKYLDPPLLPKDIKARATARMIEEVVDAHYEAINWGYGEVKWNERATGELADKLISQVKHQTSYLQSWLTEKLGDQPFFNGSRIPSATRTSALLQY